MKKYPYVADGWCCGFWNGSPLEIKYSIGRPVRDKKPHTHDFREYCIMIKGRLTVKVKDKIIVLKEKEVLMFEPNEPHQILKKEPPKDCRFVVIKEKSYPKNK